MVYRVFLGMIVLMLASKHSLGEVIKPVLVDVPITKVFIPRGFDSNDRVQLAVGGELKNSCFKISSNEVRVDSQAKTITVKQHAYVYMGFCLMMIVPYSEIVTVGIVEKPGIYQLIDGSSGAKMGSIEVSSARTLEQDEYVYAPISDVNVEQFLEGSSENNSEKNKLILSGAFSNNCTEFKEVKVSQFENTIVIQPITIFNRPLSECIEDNIKFTKTVVLDPSLRGDYLIHVRSLNGAAVNRVVEFGF